MAPGAKWGAGDFFDNKPQSKTDMDDVRAYLSKALDSVRWAETRLQRQGDAQSFIKSKLHGRSMSLNHGGSFTIRFKEN
jgi:hypothetical protein